MEQAPLPFEINFEYFEIKQKNKIYKLNIKVENKKTIVLNISEEKELFKEYEIKILLKELKLKHKVFSVINSCKEFIEFIKILITKKKLTIKKENEDILTIEMIIEYLYKQSTIKFDLKQKIDNSEFKVKEMIKQLSLMQEGNNKLKIENEILKKEKEKFKEEIKYKDSKISKLEKELDIYKNENNNLKEKSGFIIINQNKNESKEDKLQTMQKFSNQKRKRDISISKSSLPIKNKINLTDKNNNKIDSFFIPQKNNDDHSISKLYINNNINNEDSSFDNKDNKEKIDIKDDVNINSEDKNEKIKKFYGYKTKIKTSNKNKEIKIYDYASNSLNVHQPNINKNIVNSFNNRYNFGLYCAFEWIFTNINDYLTISQHLRKRLTPLFRFYIEYIKFDDKGNKFYYIDASYKSRISIKKQFLQIGKFNSEVNMNKELLIKLLNNKEIEYFYGYYKPFWKNNLKDEDIKFNKKIEKYLKDNNKEGMVIYPD